VAAPLAFKTRVRLRDEPPRGARARRFSPLTVPVALYWVGAALFSYGIMSGGLPIRRWVEQSEATEPRPATRRPERRLIAAAPRTAETRPAVWAPTAAEAPQAAAASLPEAPLPSPASLASSAAHQTSEQRDLPPKAAEPATVALLPVPAPPEPARRDDPAPLLPSMASRGLDRDDHAETAQPPPKPPAASNEPARASKATASSCEGAIEAYNEELRMTGSQGPPDISREAYAAILENGAYLLRCGVPDSMALEICAAVQHGRAVGVTIESRPRNRSVQNCVANVVRGLSFPSHRRLDVTRTSFAAQH
jgi:hypothetical protein